MLHHQLETNKKKKLRLYPCKITADQTVRHRSRRGLTDSPMGMEEAIRWLEGRKWKQCIHNVCILSFGAATEIGHRPPYCWGLQITHRHTTFDRTPLNEVSARCRHLYLTTHHTQERQISMPLAGCESTIPTSERPDTYALGYAAITNIGQIKLCPWILRASVMLYVLHNVK